MDIFESLENLPVSEECFDEIMGIVENLLAEGHNLRCLVSKAWGNGKLDAKKAIDLENKAMRIPSDNDIHVNDEGDIDSSKVTGKTGTKNGSGNIETDYRRYDKGRDRKEVEAKRYNDEKNGFLQAIAKAEKRHKKKIN